MLQLSVPAAGTTPLPDVAHPPAPWQLEGHMTIMLWLVPTRLLSDRVPKGTRPVSVGGRSILGTAWVAYEGGSLVSYDELLAAVHVWHGRAVRQTVTDIWVDSPVSVAGGRLLWGIPKDLAAFPRLDRRRFAMGAAPAGAEAGADGRIAAGGVQPDVRAAFRAGLGLPVRIPLAWSMVQELGGRLATARTSLRARPVLGRAAMRVTPGGHLGFLEGHRPFLAVQLQDMSCTFGG